MKVLMRSMALLLLMTAFLVAPGAQSPEYQDSLIYSSRAEMLSVWTAAMGASAEDLLQPTPGGITILDISGDSYQDVNTQRAVYLRQPHYPSDYYFQVRVSRFVPQDIHAQVGLVLWQDQDHYVRTTVGFIPAGIECLSEFGARTYSRNVLPLYPDGLPNELILRMEVRGEAIRGYVSYDARHWFLCDGFMTPIGSDFMNRVKGIGIIGVGGKMKELPLFSHWEEGSLKDLHYQDDSFDEDEPGAPWFFGQTNAGWHRDQVRITRQDGLLRIRPYPGSDIFLGVENYPFAMIPAPEGESWELEIKVADYDGKANGAWNKVGVVLWQHHRKFLSMALVSDEQQYRMYFESVCPGVRRSLPSAVNSLSPGERRMTDAYFRIRKDPLNLYILNVSYDGEEWVEIGRMETDMEQAQLRLFASGDVTVQYPRTFSFEAGFDHVRLLSMEPGE